MTANFPPDTPPLEPIEMIRLGCRNSKRRSIWLLNYLYANNYLITPYTSLENLNQAIDALKFNQLALKSILDAQNNLIPDENFDFISNRRRMLLVLNREIQSEIFNNNYFMPHLLDDQIYSFREKIIATIDLLNAPNQIKLLILDKLKSTWAFTLRMDEEYKWFHADRKMKTIYFKEWANNKIPYNQSTKNLDDLNDPEYIEIFLFQNFNDKRDEKEFIEKFKRAWSTKCYRERTTGKKQCNIALNTDAVKILEALCKKHGYSKSQVLEILLIGEKREGHYITKKLKEIEYLQNLTGEPPPYEI